MLAGVAYLVDESVMRGDAYAERIGVGTRELRNVIGDIALRERAKAGMERFEIFQYR
jgi:hypothetical protein